MALNFAPLNREASWTTAQKKALKKVFNLAETAAVGGDSALVSRSIVHTTLSGYFDSEERHAIGRLMTGLRNAIDSADTFTNTDVSTGDEQITLTGHLFEDKEPVRFNEDVTAPSPLVDGTTYYIRYVDANTVQLAATPGGAAINLTTAGGVGDTNLLTPVFDSTLHLSAHGGGNQKRVIQALSDAVAAQIV
jgi:hypothetical protein